MIGKVCYFYSGAIVGSMIKGGIRDVSAFDGSITVDFNTGIDDVISKIKFKQSPRNSRLVNIRTLTKM